MSSTYEKMRRVARIVASDRSDEPYAALAARYGAQLERLCQSGLLTPDEREKLWHIVDPDVDTAPAPAGPID